MTYKHVPIVIHGPDVPFLRTQRVLKNAFLRASAPLREKKKSIIPQRRWDAEKKLKDNDAHTCSHCHSLSRRTIPQNATRYPKNAFLPALRENKETVLTKRK